MQMKLKTMGLRRMKPRKLFEKSLTENFNKKPRAARFWVIIPIPIRNQPKTCEDFVPRQEGADDADQEDPLGNADAGLRQKTARFKQVSNWNRY